MVTVVGSPGRSVTETALASSRFRLGALAGFGAKFLAEFLNTTSGIDEFLLACEEGVRFGAGIEFVKGVFLAVSPLDGFFGLDCGASDEFEIVR